MVNRDNTHSYRFEHLSGSMSYFFEMSLPMLIRSKRFSLHFLRRLNWYSLRTPSNQAIILRCLNVFQHCITFLDILLIISCLLVAICTILVICTVDDWSVIVHSGCILAFWEKKANENQFLEGHPGDNRKTFDFLKWSSACQIMQFLTFSNLGRFDFCMVEVGKSQKTGR